MGLLKSLHSRATVYFQKRSRKQYCKRHYVGLKNTDFSILSQNCYGGVLTQDLGMPYTSPTVNLFFSGKDFVKFLERADYYLSLELSECVTENYGVPYPVAQLDDIRLFFVHYKTFHEAKEKWSRRLDRINWDNLFIAMTDRDGGADVLDRFSLIPYRKVFFSHLPHPEYEFVVYIPGFENADQIGDVTTIVNKRGQRMPDPFFDPIKWLNS